MRNKNVKPKIGTGTLIGPDVLKLSKLRTCGREMTGAMTKETDRCSLPCSPFEVACHYHATPAEKDAALMARMAFQMGVERGWHTKKGSDIWPDPSLERPDDPDTTPEQEADQERLRQQMRSFRI